MSKRRDIVSALLGTTAVALFIAGIVSGIKGADSKVKCPSPLAPPCCPVPCPVFDPARMAKQAAEADELRTENSFLDSHSANWQSFLNRLATPSAYGQYLPNGTITRFGDAPPVYGRSIPQTWAKQGTTSSQIESNQDHARNMSSQGISAYAATAGANQSRQTFFSNSLSQSLAAQQGSVSGAASQNAQAWRTLLFPQTLTLGTISPLNEYAAAGNGFYDAGTAIPAPAGSSGAFALATIPEYDRTLAMQQALDALLVANAIQQIDNNFMLQAHYDGIIADYNAAVSRYRAAGGAMTQAVSRSVSPAGLGQIQTELDSAVLPEWPNNFAADAAASQIANSITMKLNTAPYPYGLPAQAETWTPCQEECTNAIAAYLRTKNEALFKRGLAQQAEIGKQEAALSTQALTRNFSLSPSQTDNKRNSLSALTAAKSRLDNAFKEAQKDATYTLRADQISQFTAIFTTTK